MHDASQPHPSTSASTRQDLLFWAHLAVAGLCAILVPVVVVGAAHLTDDGGLARAAIAWLIAMLTGLAVYASAAAPHVANHTR